LDFYFLHLLEEEQQKSLKADGSISMSQGTTTGKDEEKPSNLYTIDAFHVGNVSLALFLF
jgi:hypothetical protein